MSQLLLNELFLSIYTKDGYFSLCYYSFNEEALYFKEKFSDNTLNYENVLAFVRQLRPTFCLLNLNSKLELYNRLVDLLNELSITNRIDDLEEGEAASHVSGEQNRLTKSQPPFQLTSPIVTRTSPTQSHQLSRAANPQPLQCSLQNDQITTTGFADPNISVQLLSNKYYNVELCRKTLFDCDYHQANIFTENDKRIFISSLLNLADDFLLKSIGSLLIYLDQNKLGTHEQGKGLSVRRFERFKCEGYVNVDSVTLNELNVFSYKDHPSIFKKDTFRKDDSSLFALFSKCKCCYGTNYLRRLFFQPLNDYEKLNARLDDVEQIMQLGKDVIYFYYSCLKKVKSVNGILETMKIMVADFKQFDTLARTVENLIAIHQYVAAQEDNLKIYDKLCEYYPVELEKIIHDIGVVINLKKSSESKKIEINADVNDDLDQMKLEFESVEKILSIATEHERNSKLVDYMPNFQIIFSPIFGFVIQVFHKELVDVKKMLLSLRDVEYITTTDKFMYFKTSNLKRYDESYSNLLEEIGCKQNAILLELQDSILNRFPKVFKYLEVIGEFDCLLRFAQVAKLYNYVRPTFNFSNLIDIRNGRHPLKESSFVPNDYHSEHPRSIKIITGANNSGKTIYLKQNCLIIYMAYLGSFVPADSCNIPLFSKLLTKIETIDSMSTGLSSFTNDLCRLSNIICKIPYNSLIVVDEFGKGTSYEDGLSIFSAYINYIIEENPRSHFMISTHIHTLPQFLDKNDQISYQQMEVKFEQNEIFYTYSLIDGFAEFSFPLELGKKIKFDPLVLKRAQNIAELHKLGPASFKRMAAYAIGDLKKVNEVFEQVQVIKRALEMRENEMQGVEIQASQEEGVGASQVEDDQKEDMEDDRDNGPFSGHSQEAV